MSESTEESPVRAGAALGAPARRSGRWRLATPAVVGLSGVLFVVSAVNSGGTDLRPGRYRDLASVVETQANDYDALATRVSALSGEVDGLSAAVGSQEVSRFRRRAESLRGPAGLLPVSGPGVSVVLSDSPADVFDAAVAGHEIDLRRLVVHQQDIQAVVNSMWSAGATAVTIEGQRIVSTTGIKCLGNAVQLQGIPYPQPYEIEAVGDPARLASALEQDSYLDLYRADADDPVIDVGYDFAPLAQVEAPAFDGLLDLSYAEPLR